MIKINEPRYIALHGVSGSIKKFFSIDYVNIYLFLIFLDGGKMQGYPHIAYIVIH